MGQEDDVNDRIKELIRDHASAEALEGLADGAQSLFRQTLLSSSLTAAAIASASMPAAFMSSAGLPERGMPVTASFLTRAAGALLRQRREDGIAEPTLGPVILHGHQPLSRGHRSVPCRSA